MLPILFSIGSFHIYSYVIFLVIAFFAGIFVVWKRGREVHFDETEWLECSLMLIIVGTVSARIVYSLEHIPWLHLSLGGVVQALTSTGFSTIGALVGSLLYYWNHIKKKKWEFWTGLDVLTAGLSLIMLILALGSFIGGSGYGLPTTSFSGNIFMTKLLGRISINCSIIIQSVRIIKRILSSQFCSAFY